MPTFQGETVAVSVLSKTWDKSFLKARGPRNGRNIITGVRFKFDCTTLDTGSAGITGVNFANALKRARISDGAGLRRNITGMSAYKDAVMKLGANTPPVCADIAASQSNQTRTFEVPLPFYLPSSAGPDDFCMSIADFLAGGSVQTDFAVAADFGTNVISDLGDMTCTILVDYFEELGDVRLRQRDFVNEEEQTGSRNYYANVGGALLRGLFLQKAAAATEGGTALTDVLTVTIDALGISTIPRVSMQNSFRQQNGAPPPPTITATAQDAGYHDPIQQNTALPLVWPGFDAQLSDYNFVQDRLGVRTTETSGLDGCSLISHIVTPMSAGGVAAQLAEAGLDPNTPLVADTGSRRSPSEWGAAWPYVRKRPA